MIQLIRHRCHDYQHLEKRWRRVAKRLGTPLRELVRCSNRTAWVLDPFPETNNQVLHLSAGIHGDEPAGTEALILWAENNISFLRSTPCLVLPCLNPWGLAHNNRLDERGRDLNRAYQNKRIPLVSAHTKLLSGRTFHVAFGLHEDYDAQGLYIYEVRRKRESWGEELLRSVEGMIPFETRSRIDGQPARRGLIRRRVSARKFEEMPEAIYLHVHHALRTYTVETPSEFALDQRVTAQVRVLDAVVPLARRAAESPARS